MRTIVPLLVAISALPVEQTLGKDAPASPAAEAQGENQRTPAVEPNSLGFITSDTPYCYQPNPAVNRCLINFTYIYANSSPDYFQSLDIKLNGRLVAHFQGFFQTYVSVASSQLGSGIAVKCGADGIGGQAGLGRAYRLEMRAKDSTGSTGSANYATIYCPPFTKGGLPP